MDISLVISFDRDDFVQMCRDSLIDAIPILPALRAILEVGLTLHPQFFRDDDINDDEATDFILTDSKERTERVIDLYIKRKVEVLAGTEELKAGTLEHVKSTLVDACHRRMAQIDKIATDFGLKKVFFGLSIFSDSKEEAPFEAAGTRLSFISDPMIIATPPRLSIQIDSSIGVPTEDSLLKQQALGDKSKEFIIAHEMVHIARNHALIATVSYLAYSILATSIWVAGIGAGLSLASVACTYGTVLGVAIPFQIFFNTLRRSQEKEADQEAMHYLKSNEGALAAHEALKKRGAVDDLEHPSMAQRLAYIQAYR